MSNGEENSASTVEASEVKARENETAVNETSALQKAMSRIATSKRESVKEEKKSEARVSPRSAGNLLEAVKNQGVKLTANGTESDKKEKGNTAVSLTVDVSPLSDNINTTDSGKENEKLLDTEKSGDQKEKKISTPSTPIPTPKSAGQVSKNVSKDSLNSSAGAKKLLSANKAAKLIPSLLRKGNDKKEKGNDAKKSTTVKKSPYAEPQTVTKNGDANGNSKVKNNQRENNKVNEQNNKNQKVTKMNNTADSKRGDESMSNRQDNGLENKQGGELNQSDKGKGMPQGKTKWTSIITPKNKEGGLTDNEGKDTIGNPLAPNSEGLGAKNLKESTNSLGIPKDIQEELKPGSRLSVQSSQSHRDSFSRLSIDSRFVDFAKTQNATVVHPPGTEEDEKKKGIVANNDSYIKSAIPYLPMGLAVVCLILNIILPGTGTMVSGFAILCTGRPRIESKDDTVMTSCCVNIMVGLCQLFTVTFMMVGWFWSLAWGIHMVILADEYKRELRKEHEFHLKALVIGAFRNEHPVSPRVKTDFA